jgi:hypothetical protein
LVIWRRQVRQGARGLAVVVGLLVLVGAQPAKLTLDAVGVVPAVDVAEQVQLGLLAGAVAGAVDPLDLEGGEEALGHGVVERVADRAHGGLDPRVGKALGEPDTASAPRYD